MSKLLEQLEELKNAIDEQIGEIDVKLGEAKFAVEIDDRLTHKNSGKEFVVSSIGDLIDLFGKTQKNAVHLYPVGKMPDDKNAMTIPMKNVVKFFKPIDESKLGEALTKDAKKRTAFMNTVKDWDALVMAERKLKEFSAWSTETAIKMVAKETGVDPKQLAEYVSIKHLWESCGEVEDEEFEAHMKEKMDDDTIDEGTKEEYTKFFNKKLKKYKVKSPSQLSNSDKKKFFDEIEKEWTKDED